MTNKHRLYLYSCAQVRILNEYQLFSFVLMYAKQVYTEEKEKKKRKQNNVYSLIFTLLTTQSAYFFYERQCSSLSTNNEFHHHRAQRTSRKVNAYILINIQHI